MKTILHDSYECGLYFIIEYLCYYKYSSYKEYYIDGNLLKVEYDDGTVQYYRDGYLYKSRILNYCTYFKDGVRHREDGPAIENGLNNQYFFNGEYVACKSDEEFFRILKLINFR